MYIYIYIYIIYIYIYIYKPLHETLSKAFDKSRNIPLNSNDDLNQTPTNVINDR